MGRGSTVLTQLTKSGDKSGSPSRIVRLSFALTITMEEVMRAFALGFLLLTAGPATAAEKYVGSVAEVRTIVSFRAADAAVQKLLPEGWELDVATSASAKDVNLIA